MSAAHVARLEIAVETLPWPCRTALTSPGLSMQYENARRRCMSFQGGFCTLKLKYAQRAPGLLYTRDAGIAFQSSTWVNVTSLAPSISCDFMANSRVEGSGMNLM